MLKHRIIPALLLHKNGLVKTRCFKKPKYVGDPVNAIRIFNDKGVDELIIVDMDASREKKDPNFSLIEQFAGECFMPLTYGGGITSVEQAKQLFQLGVEKISLQTSALVNLKLIRQLADRFGSQSIVVSIDLKRNWFNQPKLFNSGRAASLWSDWIEFIEAAAKAGAGEILLNSVDRDGTLSGPDLEIIKKASNSVNIPVVAMGGVASISDMKACIDAGASAVAAGAFFVFHGPYRTVLITYPEYEELEALLGGK